MQASPAILQDPTAEQERQQQADLEGLQDEMLGRGSGAAAMSHQQSSEEEQSEEELSEEEEVEAEGPMQTSEQQSLELGIRAAEYPIHLLGLLDGQIDLLDSR